MNAFDLRSPQLCLITDPAVPALLQAVEEALAAGITMLQLRGHTLSAAQLYRLALSFRPLCRRYNAAFIVNDRLDVGLAVRADGFQLGVRSLPLAVARRLVGDGCLLGMSVHSLAEAQAAAVGGADFLVVGTIFPSRSHPDEQTVGVNLLRAIRREIPTMPLLAVGGITVANAAQVMEAGASGVAVISAILDAADRTAAVSRLRATIGLEPFLLRRERECNE